MVQLTEFVERSRMFRENYVFFSSISSAIQHHFERFVADDVLDADDPFVVRSEATTGSFDRVLALRILQENGPSKVLLGANVMCHSPCIQSVAAGI